MLIMAAILAALAIPFLILGLRGRRVDDHPVCGRCKFDLAGVYPDRRICPECGSRLGPPETADSVPDNSEEPPDDPLPSDATKTARVRIGNRKRRRSLIASGIVSLLVAGILFGIVAPGIDWDRYTPYPLLRLQLSWSAESDATRTGELLGEIFYRLDKKKLEATDLAPLVKLGLKVQADLVAPWDNRWADIIELYDAEVGLSEGQLFAYLKGGSQITVGSRQAARIGDAIPIEIGHKPVRIGPGRSLYLNIEITEARIGAIDFVPSASTLSIVQRHVNGYTSGSSVRLLRSEEHIADVGVHEAQVTLKLQSLDNRVDKNVLSEWTEAFTMDVEILPRDENDIELLASSDGDAVERSVTVDSLVFHKKPDVWNYLLGKLTITADRPFSFKAVAIAGDARYDLGTLTRNWLQPGGDRHFQIYAKHLPDDFNFTTVDIELKYDLDAARNRMTMDQIYPLDMLIKDVPIEYPDPSSEPNK